MRPPPLSLLMDGLWCVILSFFSVVQQARIVSRVSKRFRAYLDHRLACPYRLEFGNCRVSDALLARFAGRPFRSVSLWRRRTQQFNGDDGGVSETGLVVLRTMPIRSLVLHMFAVHTTDGWDTLCALADTLTHLDLSRTYNLPIVLSEWQRLGQLSRLVDLDLSCNYLVTDHILVALQRLPLERLALDHCHITDIGLEHVATHLQTTLRILDLSGTRVTDGGLAHVRHLTSLQELLLCQNRGHVSEAALQHLERLPLVRLGWHGCPLTDAGLERLAVALQPTLQHLWIGQNAVTDAGLTALARHCRLLQTLRARQCPGITGASLQELARLPLTTLQLVQCPVADDCLVHLAGLAPTLTQLGLGGPTIHDTGLVHLGPLRLLQSLTLDGCAGLEGPGLVHLGGLQRLTDVNLQGSAVGDQGLRHLRQLPLRVLWMALCSNVTSAGVRHLQAHPTLQTLSLDGSRVTRVGVRSLRLAARLSVHRRGGLARRLQVISDHDEDSSDNSDSDLDRWDG